MREFLSQHQVPFDDRNIRKNQAARAELAERTGRLIVPQLFWGDRHIVGFDVAALGELVSDYRIERDGRAAG